MPRRLNIDLSKCTECLTCELKCSFVHFGVFNEKKAGIQVIPKWPGLPRVRLCIQCEDPACLPVCPTDALVMTDEGAVRIQYEDCIGCLSCVDACPFDGIWLDPLSNVVIKCDTCQAKFQCVSDCFVGALSISESA